MKGTPVDQLVYQCMFPKPRASDPQTFHALLQRNLILEVRSEVHAFYGHLDTQEAKYPGLDYCHPTHRTRLSRWPWHRRLFRAFDNLRLTPHEIATLTKWEGTRWAKERYEKEQGITIRDTAADDLPDWVEPEDRLAGTHVRTQGRGQSVGSSQQVSLHEDGEDAEDSDEEMESVGAALNERLRERVARREAGETSTVLDEEWEQWLKNAIESGELDDTARQILRQSSEPISVPMTLIPPRMLSAARAGYWRDIPEFMHGVIRQSLDVERPEPDISTAIPSPSMTPLTRVDGRGLDSRNAVGSHTWRPSFSGLRLPSGDADAQAVPEIRVQRTAEAPGA